MGVGPHGSNPAPGRSPRFREGRHDWSSRMNEGRVEHRLTGLEPDNLLAFLALLGLLRSIEAADRDHRETLKLRPRACWDTEIAPLRPVLLLARPIESEEIPLIANEGLSTLASAHRFGGRKDLNYSRTEA